MIQYNNDSILAVDDLSGSEMQHLLREMADTIVLYETIEERLITRETAIEEKLLAAESLLSQQLTQIKSLFDSFQSVMTEAGAARWRMAADTALREGEAHLDSLEELTQNITQLIKSGGEQLEQTATKTIGILTETSNTLPVDNFKQITAQSAEKIKITTDSAIKQVTEQVRLFHWKNLTMAFTLTLFLVFLTGLYTTNEWPWEIHRQVAKERTAGKTLIAAWPRLSPVEQQAIVNAGKKSPNI